MSPLDMMFARMRALWAENAFEAALVVARMAAPYVHPRAQPTPSLLAAPHTDADVLGWSFAAPAQADDDPYDA